MSRQIKSGNASVRCEEDRVIVEGTLVNEAGDPIGGDPDAPTVTVDAAEPAAPADDDVWFDVDA